MLKTLITYLLGFTFTSAIDFVWHILLFGKIYSEGMKNVGNVVDGQLKINGLTGILSQIFVVGAISFLVLYKNTELNYLDGALRGAAGGILAITVYGLVNHAFIKGWGLDITILEVVWGPIIGACSGVFITWITKTLA